MPRIPDVHLQSVVFIYFSRDDAVAGKRTGGSGFVVNAASGVADWKIQYVVTNKHVLDDGGYWVRLNHQTGTFIQHIPEAKWARAPGPDDFAVAMLELLDMVDPYRLTLDTLALTRDESAVLKVGPGDEAYMVGRFISHGGQLSNNPIARFGSISLMPDPQELVRDGRKEDVEAYLIEMRSHAGFSGSPVFLIIPANSFRGTFGDTSLEDNVTRFRLLGIDTGHIIDDLPIFERDGKGDWNERDDLVGEHQTDIAIVSPIYKVVDLLNRKDLADKRREAATDLERVRGPNRARSDAAVAPTRDDFLRDLRKIKKEPKEQASE